MTSVLITGCNRGLGLGLVQQFLRLKRQPENIFATVRDPDRAKVSVLVHFLNGLGDKGYLRAIGAIST